MDVVRKGWSFLDIFRTGPGGGDVEGPPKAEPGQLPLEVAALEREAERATLGEPLLGSISLDTDDPRVTADPTQHEAAEYLARTGNLSGYCPYCPWATCGTLYSTRRNLLRHVQVKHAERP